MKSRDLGRWLQGDLHAPTDKLPSEAEYWAAEEKKEDDAQALKARSAPPTFGAPAS